MLKQLDKLMARSFVGPFVVTFAIAMFVLMMQVLWLYLDDIAGKGLGFFVVIELMAYKCVGLVPLALPLALLISSVMVLGGMAEHYELSSFKSAGTSLLRVIRILIVFGIISAAVSFACADYVLPAANLKFGSRMYDIQQKKPTLSMEPGVFNEDFNQFAIRLGERDDNGRDISNVLIYDHTKASTGDLGQITAKTGEMYSTDDGKAFVMQLYDGVQYSEKRAQGKNRSSLPFVRTKFGSYTKVFDLSEFNMGKTNESLFKTNRSMLATWQLQNGVDSIDIDIAVRKQAISNHLVTYLPILRRDSIVHKKSLAPKFDNNVDPNGPVMDSLGREEAGTSSGDGRTLANPRKQVTNRQASPDTRIENVPTSVLQNNRRRLVTETASPRVKPEEKKRKRNRLEKALDHPLVIGAATWNGTSALLDSLELTAKNRVLNRARSAIRSVISQAQSTERILPGIRESKVKHQYDKHMKYSMALVCIIFIFIGAPMGAIVRKGGFGYPILVSIIFFVIFIILTIFCRKLAESFVVNGSFAGWLPTIILFPVSLYITRRAMKDAKLVNTDAITQVWLKLRGRFKQPEATEEMV